MKEAKMKRLNYVILSEYAVRSILQIVERPVYLASLRLKNPDSLTPNQVRCYKYWVKTYQKYVRRLAVERKHQAFRVYSDLFDLVGSKFEALYVPDYVREEVMYVQGA